VQSCQCYYKIGFPFSYTARSCAAQHCFFGMRAVLSAYEVALTMPPGAHMLTAYCSADVLRLCRCAYPVVVASIVIYFLGLLIILPFEAVGVSLQVLTLGAFSAKSVRGGLRSWVTDTTSLVPLLALSVLRSGAHRQALIFQPCFSQHCCESCSFF